MAYKNVKGNIEPPKERIDRSTWILMTAVASGVDVFQFTMLIFAPIISPIAFLTFWIWLKRYGANITDDNKRLVRMFGGFFIELTPLGVFPVWTPTIFTTVLLVRNKDKRKIREFYKNIADATARKKRYNVRTVAPYITTREVANDNHNPQEFKEAA